MCWFYSENAWVCAKWQWNPWDCVTGLHDQESWESNPVTQVFCVSLYFRSHPCVLAFITQILCINGIEMTFVWIIYYGLHYIFFKFAIYVDESGWKHAIKEMGLGDSMADDAVVMLEPVWLHAASLWIRIVTSHNAWLDYEYSLQNFTQGRFTNIILTPLKEWGVCDNI